MPAPVRIVVDTNILFSALLYAGPERTILQNSGIELFSTDFNAFEMVDVLRKRKGFTHFYALTMLRKLPVFFVPFSNYEQNLEAAYAVIGERDEKDVPLLALAFRVPNGGIWTSDKDFSVVKTVPVWRTADLKKLLYNKTDK